MNKVRRKELTDLLEKFESIQSLLLDLKDGLQSVRDEEQDAFDNMPESLQESERGEKMNTAIDALDEAISYIEDDISDVMDSVKDSIETAKE